MLGGQGIDFDCLRLAVYTDDGIQTAISDPGCAICPNDNAMRLRASPQRDHAVFACARVKQPQFAAALRSPPDGAIGIGRYIVGIFAGRDVILLQSRYHRAGRCVLTGGPIGPQLGGHARDGPLLAGAARLEDISVALFQNHVGDIAQNKAVRDNDGVGPLGGWRSEQIRSHRLGSLIMIGALVAAKSQLGGLAGAAIGAGNYPADGDAQRLDRSADCAGLCPAGVGQVALFGAIVVVGGGVFLRKICFGVPDVDHITALTQLVDQLNWVWAERFCLCLLCGGLRLGLDAGATDTDHQRC